MIFLAAGLIAIGIFNFLVADSNIEISDEQIKDEIKQLYK